MKNVKKALFILSTILFGFTIHSCTDDVTTTDSYEKTFDENSLQKDQDLTEVETIIKGASTAKITTCPARSCLSILEVDSCTDFHVVLNCANSVASVQWEYSMGPYSHVSFGSSNNSGGNYSIAKSLYLPSGSWDNYYLWVFANVTLTNGRK